MPIIELITKINAPIQRCFDLARSIDLHKLSTGGSKEDAIAGVTQGLIGMGETVTWRATHFKVRQILSSKITAFESPRYFRDEMIKGAFKYIKHDHVFEEKEGVTIMKDRFQFASPFGCLGEVANKLILTRYLKGLLQTRNEMIKEYAESSKWKLIL